MTDAAGGHAPLDPRRDGEPVLTVRGLRRYYPVRSGVLNRHTGDVKAVDGVDLDLYPGRTLAVVGESGCGKSTMAETVVGLQAATAGSVRFRGRELTELSGREMRPLRKEIGFIFQDPFSSLNERMTVGNIVREPLEIHGEHAGEREAVVEDLLEEVGLSADDYDRFPHALSGGQRQRVSIARALALNPSVVVADEPVSALDVSVQAQILRLLEDLQDEFDLTYLFISHDLSVVRHVADEVAVMYLGRIVERATADDLFADPQHPYTEALLADVPRVQADREEREAERVELAGSPPDPVDPPEGCNFHPRCPLKTRLSPADAERCETADPRPEGGHEVACHFRPN